jgi:multicomponent Na+:H+ antiporter subunit G
MSIAATVLIALGLAVSVSGAVGILRMPDVYLRIQASTKNVTLGALPVLAGLVVAKGFFTPYTGRALIIAVLLLVMNPIASHALARAAYKARVPMWKEWKDQ